MRENVEEKGRRYLLEGRLVVERVDGRVIRARCRGGGAVYALGFDGSDWFCACPALTRCSHLVALQLVTAPGASAESRQPESESVVRAGFDT